MSAAAQPITPERFAAALETLEPPQLDAESARLHNAIHHLQRSNIALEEYPDDAECRQAVYDNLETIGRMIERIRLIEAEKERRGLRAAAGTGEAAREEVLSGGMARRERAAEGSTAGAGGSTAGTDAGERGANGTSAASADASDEEEGIYL